MTIAAPPGFLVGDGHSAASRSRGRMRKYGWLATVLGVFAAVMILLVVTQVPSSTTPLSIANANDNGTRALAEVLRDHGVKTERIPAGELLETGERVRFEIPSGHLIELYARKTAVGPACQSQTRPEITTSCRIGRR